MFQVAQVISLAERERAANAVMRDVSALRRVGEGFTGWAFVQRMAGAASAAAYFAGDALVFCAGPAFRVFVIAAT